MIQGWIDDLESTGIDYANVPDEIRKKIDNMAKISPHGWWGYVEGQKDALQSVINSL